MLLTNTVLMNVDYEVLRLSSVTRSGLHLGKDIMAFKNLVGGEAKDTRSC